MYGPLRNGITIEITWFDQDIIEIRCLCSNGRFSGEAEFYIGPDDLTGLAETLRGFPSGRGDIRRASLGTLDNSYEERQLARDAFSGDGGVAIEFLCGDAQGHCSAKTSIRGGAYRGTSQVENVTLYISIEASGIDEFVGQLSRLEPAVGVVAHLPMAH